MRPAPSSVAAAAIAVALSVSMALLSLCTADADELTLNDGTKITGTIVGFEAKSFRVRTSYGFAEVQRDQVVSIRIADAAKAAAPAESPKPALATRAPGPNAGPLPPANPAPGDAKSAARTAKSESTHEVRAASRNTRGAKSAAITSPSIAMPAVSAPVKTAAAATVSSASAAPTPTVATSVTPPKPAPLAPIREEIFGNTYVNETYRFEMYKPPDWEIIDGARSILPGAIAAMGTEDATTYLLVGQEPSAKSLAGAMDAAESRLQNVMENYRPLGEERVTVSGNSAIAQHFRGSVDEHDWSGVVVLVPRGSHVYAIFGMTRADNDLVQIEENVIARTISSFEFTASN